MVKKQNNGESSNFIRRFFLQEDTNRLKATWIVVGILSLLFFLSVYLFIKYELITRSSPIVSFFMLMVSSIAILLLLWLIVYFIYMRIITTIYRHYILEKVTVEDADTESIKKLKWLFFRRYNSYSLSAYFILLIAAIILLICIGIFLYVESLIDLNTLDDKTFKLAFVITIRLGIASIAIYIVQVLLRLYRYNLRIASFYTSLFDTLMIKDLKHDKLAEIISMLTPKVDIGKEPPVSPLQELLEALKNPSSIVKRKE